METWFSLEPNDEKVHDLSDELSPFAQVLYLNKILRSLNFIVILLSATFQNFVLYIYLTAPWRIELILNWSNELNSAWKLFTCWCISANIDPLIKICYNTMTDIKNTVVSVGVYNI